MDIIGQTLQFLENNGIECYYHAGILVVLTDNADELDVLTSKVAKLLKEFNYSGRWRIDTYFYDRHREDDFYLETDI